MQRNIWAFGNNLGIIFNQRKILGETRRVVKNIIKQRGCGQVTVSAKFGTYGLGEKMRSLHRARRALYQALLAANPLLVVNINKRRPRSCEALTSNVNAQNKDYWQLCRVIPMLQMMEVLIPTRQAVTH